MVWSPPVSDPCHMILPSGSPTFVQGVGSQLNDNNGITGNGYVFNLPNATLAGNCLVLAVAYPFSAGRTFSIVDSTGDVWPTAAITTGTASNGNMNAKIYVLPNASAGLHTITFTFDTALKPFQYTLTEYYNVATASPVNGSHGTNSVAGPNVSAGAFTPGNNDSSGGNLIFTYAISNDNIGTNAANILTNIAITGGVSPLFMHANSICTIPSVSSYDVQPTSGSINPGFTLTQSSGTNFVCAAVALKAASAGQAPAAGIRIKRLLHYTSEAPTASDVFICPCEGNLLVAAMPAGDDLNPGITVADSNGQSYTNPGVSGQPQVFIKQNATPSNTLKVTFTNGATRPQFSVHFYDIVGAQASSLLNTNGLNQQAPASSPYNNFPNHTPTFAPGLTLCITGFGTAAQSAMASGAPAGSVFDCVSYTTAAAFDGDQMDNADPYGHVNYSTTAVQNWNWVLGAAAFNSTSFVTAVSFK